MAQQLKLTAAQQSQIKAIQERNAPLSKAIFADKSLSRAQRREKMQSVRKQFDAAIGPILTSEQRTQYAAL